MVSNSLKPTSGSVGLIQSVRLLTPTPTQKRADEWGRGEAFRSGKWVIRWSKVAGSDRGAETWRNMLVWGSVVGTLTGVVPSLPSQTQVMLD